MKASGATKAPSGLHSMSYPAAATKVNRSSQAAGKRRDAMLVIKAALSENYDGHSSSPGILSVARRLCQLAVPRQILNKGLVRKRPAATSTSGNNCDWASRRPMCRSSRGTYTTVQVKHRVIDTLRGSRAL